MGRVSRVLCVGVILVVLTTVVQCVGAESLKRTFLQPAPDLIKENFPLSNLTRHVVDRVQLADRKYETTKDDDVSSCGLFVFEGHSCVHEDLEVSCCCLYWCNS